MEQNSFSPQILDTHACSAWISSGGPLEKLFDDFEERPGQIALLERICETFNKNKVGVFEAGTGIGKSFAYLLPAVLWALKNKERVVISTGTINLQQQLFEKDVPAARRILNEDFKAVLMKGRHNYICRRRLNDALNEIDLFDDEKEELQRISAWASQSESGSNSDLSFMPSQSLWQRINSESDVCMGSRCRFYENCFVMKMRKEASCASVLIVNHHLLFADMETRSVSASFDDNGILPAYKRLILDEAHDAEKAATGFFSESLNRFSLLKQLNKLHRTRKSASAGFLYDLQTFASDETAVQEVLTSLIKLKTYIQTMEEQALTLFGENSVWRLCESTAVQAQGFIAAMDTLASGLSLLCSQLRTLIDSIDDENTSAPAVWESKQIMKRLEAYAQLGKNFGLWNENADKVFWLEKRFLEKTQAYPVCYQTPLDIAPLMHNGLFEPLDTVVCTSATLTVAGNFYFWMKRSGAFFVDKDRLLNDSFASPFDYKNNVLLSVVSDMPLPSSSDFQQHLEQAIVNLIRSSSGRALVLFTSYESMRSACDYARNMLSGESFCIYRQGDDDRFRLLEQFKTQKESVLFATDSFWEGVDIPGESLSHVIIAKLPFTVPSNPVFAARSEDIDKRGGSSFMELSVPEAVIRFRQGFGRLLRRCADRGAVTVLDRRLIEKRYGALFLQSVPETKRMFDTAQNVCASVQRFLDS